MFPTSTLSKLTGSIDSKRFATMPSPYTVLSIVALSFFHNAPPTRHVTNPVLMTFYMSSHPQRPQNTETASTFAETTKKYIRTMSLQYTISLAKPGHLDRTPEGLDTRMASYLKHPWPWVLVLLLPPPRHRKKASLLQVIDPVVTHLKSRSLPTVKELPCTSRLV